MFCPNNTTNAADDSKYLDIASIVSCILSMAGAVIIVLTYCCMETIRNTTRKLVTVLSVADFITSAGYLSASVMTQRHANIMLSFCAVQGVVTTYSTMVSFSLTVAIAGYLFFAISMKAIAGKRFYIASNIVSWIIPGIVIAVFINEHMMDLENWKTQTIGIGPCSWISWIRCYDGDEEVKKYPLFYTLCTGKFWEISCYLLTATFYVLLKFKLYLHHRFHTLDQLNPDLRSDDRNFLYVWLVLLAVRSWGTIRFSITAISTKDLPRDVDTVMLYLQAIGDPSQAFFNCILFCLFDKEVRGRMVRAMKSRIPSPVNGAPNEPDSNSSLPCVGPSGHESQWSDSSAEVSERSKLVNNENPGHEKLYQSVNQCWSESTNGST